MLRDYQVRAVKECRHAFQNGKKAPLIVCPTGGGKTRIAAEIVRSGVARGTRFLWLAHRNELVQQAFDVLMGMGVMCGAIGASVGRPCFESAPVQVAMIQTLNAREIRPYADIAIIDEAHHACADDYVGLLSGYAQRIGLTATPARTDGRGLGAVFDVMVVAESISGLTERGILVPCEVVRPDEQLPRGKIAQSPLRAYRDFCQGRQAVVFSGNLVAAEQHAAELIRGGVRAMLIRGETQNRADYMKPYLEGNADVLVNCNVLTEGWDHPPTSAVILARGCESPSLFLQMVGRALRASPGKTSAVLVDLRGVTHDPRIGLPDAVRTYSLDGRGIRAGAGDDVRRCPVCSSEMGDAEAVCVACGYESSSVATAPTVVNASLKYARIRLDTPSERAERLSRWLAEAERRGYKPGWAAAKYAAVYGEWPRAPWRRQS